MTEVLAITGPLFALIAVGWLVARAGLFSRDDVRALGRYVVMLALPALIFRAVTTGDLRTAIHVPYLAAYLAGSVAFLALGYRLARPPGRAGPRPPSTPWASPAPTAASWDTPRSSWPCPRSPTGYWR